MAKSKYLTAPLPSKKTPAGIPYILTNEAAERFSFYGNRCILVFFMTHLLKSAAGQLAPMTPEQSKFWFHLFVSAVYFTPLIGALLSDIWLAKYRTIIFFSIIYCFGFFAITIDHTRLGLGVGLILIALGSGVIKPCVSANVGDQFGKTNQHLMFKIYVWFYFAINLGAFISNLLVPELLKRYGPTIAFGCPSVFMVLATLAFWMGRQKFVHIPPAGGKKFVEETFGEETFKAFANFSKKLRFFTVDFRREGLRALWELLYLGAQIFKSALRSEGVRALGKLCIIYVFVAPFWALFDQIDSAWMLQAEKMNRHLLFLELEPTQIVAANPLMIMLLIPVFSYVIYPAINKVFPLTALRKIGIGLFVAALSFAVSALIETRITAGARPGIVWLILAYLILTSAEVMVSITCLEFSYTQAPKKMKSFIMAVFFLSITLGNIFTATVNKFIQNEDGTSKLPGASYYWFFVGVMLVTAVLFIPVASRYKVKDYIQDEASAESSA